jgi:hypothetical protein
MITAIRIRARSVARMLSKTFFVLDFIKIIPVLLFWRNGFLPMKSANKKAFPPQRKQQYSVTA